MPSFWHLLWGFFSPRYSFLMTFYFLMISCEVFFNWTCHRHALEWEKSISFEISVYGSLSQHFFHSFCQSIFLKVSLTFHFPSFNFRHSSFALKETEKPFRAPWFKIKWIPFLKASTSQTWKRTLSGEEKQQYMPTTLGT